jgi:hypothetical protein
MTTHSALWGPVHVLKLLPLEMPHIAARVCKVRLTFSQKPKATRNVKGAAILFPYMRISAFPLQVCKVDL